MSCQQGSAGTPETRLSQKNAEVDTLRPVYLNKMYRVCWNPSIFHCGFKKHCGCDSSKLRPSQHAVSCSPEIWNVMSRPVYEEHQKTSSDRAACWLPKGLRRSEVMGLLLITRRASDGPSWSVCVGDGLFRFSVYFGSSAHSANTVGKQPFYEV